MSRGDDAVAEVEKRGAAGRTKGEKAASLGDRAPLRLGIWNLSPRKPKCHLPECHTSFAPLARDQWVFDLSSRPGTRT